MKRRLVLAIAVCGLVAVGSAAPAFAQDAGLTQELADKITPILDAKAGIPPHEDESGTFPHGKVVTPPADSPNAGSLVVVWAYQTENSSKVVRVEIIDKKSAKAATTDLKKYFSTFTPEAKALYNAVKGVGQLAKAGGVKGRKGLYAANGRYEVIVSGSGFSTKKAVAMAKAIVPPLNGK